MDRNDPGAAGMAGQPPPGFEQGAVDDLAVRLSEVARSLADEDDVDRTLQATVRAAVDTIPGAQHAGVMILERRRRVETRAATSDLVLRVDRAQLETDQGPCLDTALEENAVRRTGDLSAEQRWPAFGRRAAELGVSSMLSFQLFVRQDTLGSLNLYSGRKNAFDEESEHIGMLFAVHAAVAVSGARQQEHFARAISARDLIGQAKGILMERHKLTADQAFGVLTRVSQESNTKLIDVARSVAETGELATRRR